MTSTDRTELSTEGEIKEPMCPMGEEGKGDLEKPRKKLYNFYMTRQLPFDWASAWLGAVRFSISAKHSSNTLAAMGINK